MKVVINRDCGGFYLPNEAISRYRQIKGISDEKLLNYDDIPRDDPALIQVVEELKKSWPDPRYKMLKRWIGEDNVKIYIDHLKGAKC